MNTVDEKCQTSDQTTNEKVEDTINIEVEEKEDVADLSDLNEKPNPPAMLGRIE